MDLNGLSTRSTWAHPVVVGLGVFVASVGLVTQSSGAVTLDAVADTYVDSLNPDTNYGSAGELVVAMRDQPSAGVAQTLIQFDLSSIPVGSTIQSATLRLNMTLATGETPVMLSVNLCWAAWQENEVTYNSVPYFDGRGQSSIGDQTGWVEWNVTVLVMDWMGGYPNNGVVIAGPTSGDDYLREFTSREKGPPAQLVVVFTTTRCRPQLAEPFTPTPRHRPSQYTPAANHIRRHPPPPTNTPTTPPGTHTPTPTWTPTRTLDPRQEHRHPAWIRTSQTKAMAQPGFWIRRTPIDSVVYLLCVLTKTTFPSLLQSTTPLESGSIGCPKITTSSSTIRMVIFWRLSDRAGTAVEWFQIESQQSLWRIPSTYFQPVGRLRSLEALPLYHRCGSVHPPGAARRQHH